MYQSVTPTDNCLNTPLKDGSLGCVQFFAVKNKCAGELPCPSDAMLEVWGRILPLSWTKLLKLAEPFPFHVTGIINERTDDDDDGGDNGDDIWSSGQVCALLHVLVYTPRLVNFVGLTQHLCTSCTLGPPPTKI